MNSLKFLALSRIPAKRTGTQIVRQLSSTSVKQRYGSGYRNPYEDSLLSVGSNMMRSMEREMENAMRSFNRFMPTQFFLPSSNAKTNTASLAKSKSDQNELVTTDESGNRNFSLPLDLSDFSPEEIRIRTDADHNMTITAKKEIAEDDGSYYLREVVQSYKLPKELKLEDLKSKWTDQGVLIISGPLPKELEGSKNYKGPKTISIEHGGPSVRKLHESGLGKDETMSTASASDASSTSGSSATAPSSSSFSSPTTDTEHKTPEVDQKSKKPAMHLGKSGKTGHSATGSQPGI